MPLTGLYGDTGSGKTTMAVFLLAKYCYKFEKFGNFDTTLPKWKKMDIVEITELPETDKIRVVVRDEGYTDYDNRRSMEEENIFNTYLLMQQRKANMSIMGISQLNILDVRWRGLEKITILCKDRPIYDSRLRPYTGDFKYVFIQKGYRPKNYTLPYKLALKLFPYFKTKQKILPRDYDAIRRKIKAKNPEEKLKIIDDYVNEIIEKYRIPEIKKEITHDWVFNAMMEMKQDLLFERYVYYRLRNRIEQTQKENTHTHTHTLTQGKNKS